MPLLSMEIQGDSRSALGIVMQSGDKTNEFAVRVVRGYQPVSDILTGVDREVRAASPDRHEELDRITDVNQAVRTASSVQ